MRDGKIVNVISDREEIKKLVLIGKQEIGDGIPLEAMENNKSNRGLLPNVVFS